MEEGGNPVEAADVFRVGLSLILVKCVYAWRYFSPQGPINLFVPKHKNLLTIRQIIYSETKGSLKRIDLGDAMVSEVGRGRQRH